MKYGKGSVYANLTLTLGGREVVPDPPSAQENNRSEKIKTKYYTRHIEKETLTTTE